MRTDIRDEDEGKRVVNDDGDEIGMVTSIRGGTAHVDPNPGLTDTVKSKLGWGDADEDTYPLPDNSIEEVTDDEVRIRSNF